MADAPRVRARTSVADPGQRIGLAGSFGLALAHQRLAVGWSRERLAAEVGVSGALIRKLEVGRTRPDESLTRRLAVALRGPDAGPVDVAVTDLVLQAAAGDHLHRWRRRRPISRRRARAYARARELLDRPVDDPAGAVALGIVLAGLDQQEERS